MRSTISCTGVLLLTLFSVGRSAAAAENGDRIKPGELVIDPPTLINLGFEWLVQGDDNHNARVDVSYHKQGETQWKQGLPLLRLHGERIYQNQGVFEVISPTCSREASWTHRVHRCHVYLQAAGCGCS